MLNTNTQWSFEFCGIEVVGDGTDQTDKNDSSDGPDQTDKNDSSDEDKDCDVSL